MGGAGPAGDQALRRGEIVEEERPARLTWKSTGGALDVSGKARFSGEDGGTRLCYELDLGLPAVAAKLGDADGEVKRTLEKLKALAEG